MAFKKMDDSLGFSDLALASSLKHNRSLKLMENLNASIDWNRIESILLTQLSGFAENLIAVFFTSPKVLSVTSIAT